MRTAAYALVTLALLQPAAGAAAGAVALTSADFDAAVLGRPELWIMDFYAPVSARSRLSRLHLLMGRRPEPRSAARPRRRTVP